MAGTVSISNTLRVAIDSSLVDVSRITGIQSFATTAGSPRYVHGIINATVTATAIDLEGITPGFGLFVNHEASIYMQVGIDEATVFHPFLRLQAGSIGCGELEEQPYVKAQTGTGRFEYFIVEK